MAVARSKNLKPLAQRQKLDAEFRKIAAKVPWQPCKNDARRKISPRGLVMKAATHGPNIPTSRQALDKGESAFVKARHLPAPWIEEHASQSARRAPAAVASSLAGLRVATGAEHSPPDGGTG